MELLAANNNLFSLDALRLHILIEDLERAELNRTSVNSHLQRTALVSRSILIHPLRSLSNFEPVRNLNLNHTTALEGSCGNGFELKLKGVVVALVTKHLISRLFTMSLRITSNRQVTERHGARLNGNCWECSLPLVLNTFFVIVVTNLNGLKILARPRSVEVGEHHVDHLSALHTSWDVSKVELQNPEIVFLDLAINFHLFSAVILFASKRGVSVTLRFDASSTLERLVASPVLVGGPDKEFETLVGLPFACPRAV
jgi:hypothetical protein